MIHGPGRTRSTPIAGLAVLTAGLAACQQPRAPEIVGSPAVPVPRAAPARPAVEVPISARQLEVTYRGVLAGIPAGAKTLRVWVPLPRDDDPDQEISGLEIAAPAVHAVRTEREYGNRMASFTLAAPLPERLEVALRFRVTRRETWANLRPTPDPGIPDASGPAAGPGIERYLQADALVPVGGPFEEVLAEVVPPTEPPLEALRRIYDHLASTMRYSKEGKGWGNGDSLWACDARYGNCTDFHSVFISLCRTRGIPARFEMGFPLPAKRGEGEVPGYHCWARAFLAGTGWIPVDISEVAKRPEMKYYYFGNLTEDRILFTVGRDLTLDPTQQGPPLNYFVYPYAEADGAPVQGKATLAFRDVR